MTQKKKVVRLFDEKALPIPENLSFLTDIFTGIDSLLNIHLYLKYDSVITRYIASPEDICTRLEEINQEDGSIAILIITAHGAPGIIMFGDKEYTMNHDRLKALSCLKTQLSEGVKIILEACYSAAKDDSGLSYLELITAFAPENGETYGPDKSVLAHTSSVFDEISITAGPELLDTTSFWGRVTDQLLISYTQYMGSPETLSDYNIVFTDACKKDLEHYFRYSSACVSRQIKWSLSDVIAKVLTQKTKDCDLFEVAKDYEDSEECLRAYYKELLISMIRSKKLGLMDGSLTELMKGIKNYVEDYLSNAQKDLSTDDIALVEDEAPFTDSTEKPLDTALTPELLEAVATAEELSSESMPDTPEELKRLAEAAAAAFDTVEALRPPSGNDVWVPAYHALQPYAVSKASPNLNATLLITH